MSSRDVKASAHDSGGQNISIARRVFAALIAGRTPSGS
jgi:hypothetical protein